MNFSELLEKNKVEIREDDDRKNQALQQFREILSKHQFIKKCRQDDICLLQFLRKRKYAMDAAVKTLEDNLFLRKKQPDWFGTDPDSIERLKGMARSGFGCIFPDRNYDGSRLIMAITEKFDSVNFEVTDIFRSSIFAVSSILENEDDQIMGCTYVISYINTPLSFFASFPISDTIDWVKSTESVPGRFKKIIILGLPSYAVKLFNMMKMAMSEKQQSRLIVVNNLEEFHQHVNPKILLEQFGGSYSEEEIVEHTIKVVDNTFLKLKESNDFAIDEAYVKSKGDETEAIGSFRKLEID